MSINQLNISEQLRSSREEMYGAFELFHSHVKYTTTLMVSFFTAMIAITVIAAKFVGVAEVGRSVFFLVLGATMFLMAIPIGHYSKEILRRYFRVYVAAMQFSHILHIKYGLDFHPWLITEGRDEYKIEKENLATGLDTKIQSKNLSLSLYLRVLKVIMGFAACIAFALLSTAVARFTIENGWLEGLCASVA